MSNLPAGGPFKAAMNVMEPLSKEHIRKMTAMLKVYCSSKFDKEYCNTFLRYINETSKYVSRIRIERLGIEEVGDTGYEGLDKALFEFIARITHIYSLHLNGCFTTTENAQVLTRVKNYFAAPWSKTVLMPGEYVFLPFSQSVIMSALGLVEPLRSHVLIRCEEG
ncbi:MAG: hypothetical protein LRS47_03530 [Desulfurococcales archaeon]|nr:hypothetical protein [Desulfurococcales archaeon]